MRGSYQLFKIANSSVYNMYIQIVYYCIKSNQRKSQVYTNGLIDKAFGNAIKVGDPNKHEEEKSYTQIRNAEFEKQNPDITINLVVWRLLHSFNNGGSKQKLWNPHSQGVEYTFTRR